MIVKNGRKLSGIYLDGKSLEKVYLSGKLIFNKNIYDNTFMTVWFDDGTGIIIEEIINSVNDLNQFSHSNISLSNGNTYEANRIVDFQFNESDVFPNSLGNNFMNNTNGLRMGEYSTISYIRFPDNLKTIGTEVFSSNTFNPSYVDFNNVQIGRASCRERV